MPRMPWQVTLSRSRDELMKRRLCKACATCDQVWNITGLFCGALQLVRETGRRTIVKFKRKTCAKVGK